MKALFIGALALLAMSCSPAATTDQATTAAQTTDTATTTSTATTTDASAPHSADDNFNDTE